MAETSQPIAVLILGNVRRTGEGVLKNLVEKGCTVVVGNRAPDPDAAGRDGYYTGLINLVDSTELGNQADDIRRRHLGPDKYFNVVIYNAFHAGACEVEAPDQHLSVDVNTMRGAAEVDILSVYAAAKFAIHGFSKLPPSVPRVFIVEGSAMPFTPVHQRYISLGFGRVCQAYLIDYLATYRRRSTGERFYFAYQVGPNNNLIPSETEISPEAHGKAYWALIDGYMPEDWHIRFDGAGDIIGQSPVDA